jgi:predicted nucleic acid-binding protein
VGHLILDASVLVALMDTRDLHHDAARRLIREQPTYSRFAISASVYAEVLIRALAHGTADKVDRVIERFDVEIVPIDRAIARAAASLRAAARRPLLRLPDALAVAVALVADPPLPFATFDDRLAQRYAAEIGDRGR